MDVQLAYLSMKGQLVKNLSAREMAPVEAILLFGASGHIGGPAAETIVAEAPHVRLRLATSREDQIAGLQARFPSAEIVRADYLNLDSLIAATDGIDTMFVITPDFLDERSAMTNIVAAAKRGTPRHIVRLTGDPTHVHRPEQVSSELMAWPDGVALNHLRARAVLEDSDVPVTFVNISAYYMDNFALLMGGPIIAARTLCVPYDRHMNYIDPRDVGAVVGKLLLSNDRYHLGKTYHLDNGVDCMTFAEVARLMSEVFGETIAYDDSPETFRSQCGPMIAAKNGSSMVDYLLAYFRWEQTADTIWRRTDILSSLFGIKGRTLREWLEENRSIFVPER